MAENLDHKIAAVQSDCLKVLYEIGYLAPELIADYVDRFLALLGPKHRMVWRHDRAGHDRRAQTCRDLERGGFRDRCRGLRHGDHRGLGIRTLARLAAANDAYCQRLFPLLMKYLKECLPRDVPTHAKASCPR